MRQQKQPSGTGGRAGAKKQSGWVSWLLCGAIFLTVVKWGGVDACSFLTNEAERSKERFTRRNTFQRHIKHPLPTKGGYGVYVPIMNMKVLILTSHQRYLN